MLPVKGFGRYGTMTEWYKWERPDMAKRKSQLVCQHLENISRKMLEEYQDVIRSFVRGRNGVYALYRRGKLYYVGLTGSLLGRLKMHLRDRHGDTWDRFSVYLTIGPAYMKEIESVLIRISNPPGNKQRGKFIRSENLLPSLKAEYRRLKKQEEEVLFGSRKKARKKSGGPKRTAEPKARTPVLAPYAGEVKKLRARFKGRLVHARVLKDGRVSYGGQRYTSPSLAAATACGRRSSNGWSFWTYERAPGDWVPINELRK